MFDFIDEVGDIDFQLVKYSHGEYYRQACLDRGSRNWISLFEPVGGVTHQLSCYRLLGYSSNYLSDSTIGISFQEDMPLDRKIDGSLDTSAADIENGFDQQVWQI